MKANARKKFWQKLDPCCLCTHNPLQRSTYWHLYMCNDCILAILLITQITTSSIQQYGFVRSNNKWKGFTSALLSRFSTVQPAQCSVLTLLLKFELTQITISSNYGFCPVKKHKWKGFTSALSRFSTLHLAQCSSLLSHQPDSTKCFQHSWICFQDGQ